MLYKHKRGEAVYLLKDNKPVMHIHIDGNYYPIDLEVFNYFQEQSNRIRAEARAEALDSFCRHFAQIVSADIVKWEGPGILGGAMSKEYFNKMLHYAITGEIKE